jgi:hypothetical protein
LHSHSCRRPIALRLQIALTWAWWCSLFVAWCVCAVCGFLDSVFPWSWFESDEFVRALTFATDRNSTLITNYLYSHGLVSSRTVCLWRSELTWLSKWLTI